MKMKDLGWIWEGHGMDPGVYPSIFGVGEGAEYFGLEKAVLMFHPNNELLMKKVSSLKEVICDISKWKFRNIVDVEGVSVTAVEHWIDGSAVAVCREAKNVSDLSSKYSNITGAFHDDMRGLVKRFGCKPEDYKQIYDSLHSINPKLKLWSCVYTHELSPDEWIGFIPYMDIINLWVWKAEDLPKLDEYLKKCCEIFPSKPINMGIYLRDYPMKSPVPMHLLKLQMGKILKYIQNSKIQGYTILGACLIDGQIEQANWVRDFIAAN